MGLDMYLDAEVYVPRNEYHHDGDGLVATPVPAFYGVAEQVGAVAVLDKDAIQGIRVHIPVAYWRNAQGIHDWFVTNCAGDGVDDGNPVPVSVKQLTDLLDTCVMVRDNHSRAKTLLPPGHGFTLDEWYYSAIDYTIARLEQVLASDYDEFSYAGSW